MTVRVVRLVALTVTRFRITGFTQTGRDLGRVHSEGRAETLVNTKSWTLSPYVLSLNCLTLNRCCLVWDRKAGEDGVPTAA